MSIVGTGAMCFVVDVSTPPAAAAGAHTAVCCVVSCCVVSCCVVSNAVCQKCTVSLAVDAATTMESDDAVLLLSLVSTYATDMLLILAVQPCVGWYDVVLKQNMNREDGVSAQHWYICGI